MTAEIVLMNKQGVALAADSAVTIGRGLKIYNSANKLFSLSKKGKVGLMIYGNSSFMGIPYETIIKVYREGGNDFDTLKEYAYDFISFLKTYSDEMYEELNVDLILHKLFDEILKKADKRILERYKETTPSLDDQYKTLFSVMDDYIKNFSEMKGLGEDSFIEYGEIKDRYGEVVDTHIDKRGEKLSGAKKVVYEKLIEILFLYLNKDTFKIHKSGIVIAGFGRQDIFPRLVSYDIDGIYNNRLRYKKDNYRKIGRMQNNENDEYTAVIAPYAQQEMVHSFITGIDPSLESAIRNSLHEIFNNHVDLLRELIKEKNIDVNIDYEMKKVFDALNTNLYRMFVEDMDRDISINHISPLIDNLRSLPKEELGEMAKALVNLTSLKRRVSLEDETVGGPVDVAVISKGDGFIWLDRKHYFRPELNHDYFIAKENENDQNIFKRQL